MIVAGGSQFAYGQICVFGLCVPNPMPSPKYLDTVDVFNVKEETWRGARRRLPHNIFLAPLVRYRDSFIVVGGNKDQGSEEGTANIYRYT